MSKQVELRQDVTGIVCRPGDLAYYETTRGGLVPVKVLGWTTDAMWPHAAQLTARVTAHRPHDGYSRGDAVTTSPRHIIPRHAIITRRGSYGRSRIVLPYRWEA